MIVAFWSPTGGQAGTTSNMLAISTSLALRYQIRSIMCQVSGDSASLEKPFYGLKSVDVFKDTTQGMPDLEKLVVSGMIIPESVKGSSEFLVRERLDILIGNPKVSDEEYLKKLYGRILNSSREIYQVTFVDVGSGDGEVAEEVLKMSDLVVVNLSQNLTRLDGFFKDKRHNHLHEGKSKFYCFGNFEVEASLTLDKICSRYRLNKKEVGIVPRNIKFMDAMNNNDLMDYILRVQEVKKKWLEINPDADFISNVRTTGRRILDSIGLFPTEEVKV